MKRHVLSIAIVLLSGPAMAEDLELNRTAGQATVLSQSLFVVEDATASGTYEGGTVGGIVGGIGLGDSSLIPNANNVSSPLPYATASSMQIPGTGGFGDVAINSAANELVQVLAGTGSDPGGWIEATLSMSVNDPDGTGATWGWAIFSGVMLETTTAAGVPTLWANGSPIALVSPDTLIVSHEYVPIGTTFQVFAQGNATTALPAASEVNTLSFGKVVAAPFPTGTWTNSISVYEPDEEEPSDTIAWTSPFFVPMP